MSSNQEQNQEKNQQKIQTAVISAGGFGSRFLPATKCIPKDLMPVINKPIIYQIIEQCLEAGITEIIIVSRPENTAIVKFFEKDALLEAYLTEKGKLDDLAEIEKITNLNVTIVNQNEDLPYGNARPLYTVKDMLKNKPFIYSYGDDLVFGKDAGIIELVKQYEKNHADCVLMCTEVADEMVSKVGIIQPDLEHPFKVKSIIEKPKLQNAPSRLASVAAYAFTPRIFDYLDPTEMGEIGEFYIQAGIDQLIHHGSVEFCSTKGTWLTVGDPLNYLKTTVEIALSRADVKEEFVAYLTDRLKNI